jgi:hypothetical protein
MIDPDGMLFPRTIPEEIERLEADIADGAFQTAEDLARANIALTGLRATLQLSELIPDNDNFHEDERELMEEILKMLPPPVEPPEDMVW